MRSESRRSFFTMKLVVILLSALALTWACPNQEHSGSSVKLLKAHLALLKEQRMSSNRADRPLNWLESGHVYQIYPRSFQDSNGDGIGDIQGIISRLDHFVELGVNVIWLSPIFKSPMADFGYDISDFLDIDPIFGTIEDFSQLTAAAKAKNLKIVLDIVPNHSSDEHEWFVKSAQRIEPYTDYYVWRDGRSPGQPPNNWV